MSTPSPSQPQYSRLQFYLSDLVTVNQLNKGEKLQVVTDPVKRLRVFEISYGSTESYLGRSVQACVRSYNNWTGTAAADRESVLSHFEELVLGVESLFSKNENNAFPLAEKVRDIMGKALLKLPLLEEVYPEDGVRARIKFLTNKMQAPSSNKTKESQMLVVFDESHEDYDD